MSTSNNRRNNNRTSGSSPQRRPSAAAKRSAAKKAASKKAASNGAHGADDPTGPDAAKADGAVAGPRLPDSASTTGAPDQAAREAAREAAERPRRKRAPSKPDTDSRSEARPAKRPRPSDAAGKSRSADPAARRSSAGRSRDAAPSNGSRGAPEPRSDVAGTTGERRAVPAEARRNGTAGKAQPQDGRPRRAPKPRPDAPVRRPARRSGEPRRFDVTYGEAAVAIRDHSLEALWYELADRWGPSDVGPIALVPVAPMTTADAALYAERFVSIGAAIDGDRVKLITALDLWPSDTSLAHEIEQSRSERTAIVLEAPALNPASIPIIRLCTTVVPVVQLGLSEEDEVAQLLASLGRTDASTVLCIDRPKRRRGLARLRRAPKKVTAKA